MESGETLVGHWKLSQGRLGVASDFCTLTRKARAGKELGVPGHAIPNEAASDVAEESIAASMSKAMARREDLVDHGRRHHGTRRARGQGDIAEESGRPG